MIFRIDVATPHDAPDIYRISREVHQRQYAEFIPADQREAFNERYSITPEKEARYVAGLLQKMKDPRWHIWVARLGKRVVGFTMAWQAEASVIMKRGIFVDTKYQGKGIGKALFEASLQIAPNQSQVFLDVIESNKKARHLYETHGFVEYSRDKTFFGAPLITMRHSK